MNLDLSRLKNETEDLLLPITKHCETPIEQTHTNPQETFELRHSQRKLSLLEQSNEFDVVFKGLIGATFLEVYKSIFNTMGENIKFKLYTILFDELSFTEAQHELGLSDKLPQSLENEIKDHLMLKQIDS